MHKKHLRSTSGRRKLPFEILTNDKLEAARTRNWFLETDLVIARLDKLSRDEDVQQKLQAPDAGWDLVVCDEAHKLSATFFGGEVKYTKRYRLGQLLSGLTRHFLLMTATPHNGKEQDFQLFLALLDGDRFQGRFRDGVHRGRRLGPDAAHGQGAAAEVRRQAAVSGADRLYRPVPALRRGSPPVYGRHRLRARGVQPRRGARQRQAGGHGRFRADDPAAPARLVARGDLPVVAAAA